VSGSDGDSLTFQLPSDALSSFSDPNSPVLLLPPLGTLYSATHVVRAGDVYEFVVPRLYLASGWVAYAPLSHHILPLPLIVARDVHADAVLRGGYVVTLTFPQGIHTTHPRLTEVAVWHISDIGSRAFRKAPNVG
jgi:hypothetical protein